MTDIEVLRLLPIDCFVKLSKNGSEIIAGSSSSILMDSKLYLGRQVVSIYPISKDCISICTVD